MTIKRAYHRLRRKDGQVINGPLVVVSDEDNRFLSYHPLQQEEETTVWVGGTVLIDDDELIINK